MGGRSGPSATVISNCRGREPRLGRPAVKNATYGEAMGATTGTDAMIVFKALNTEALEQASSDSRGADAAGPRRDSETGRMPRSLLRAGEHGCRRGTTAEPIPCVNRFSEAT